MVLVTADVGSLILSISGLSFLGLGAQPPIPEWGAMLNDGRPFLASAPQLMFLPGLAIFSSVMAANLLGDSVVMQAQYGLFRGLLSRYRNVPSGPQSR